MGTAWASRSSYPWEYGYYIGGIETVKVNIMLRIYSNQWHVYAGLAILNPSAKKQIHQYAQSVTDLFKLMLAGDAEGLRKRVYDARDRFRGGGGGAHQRNPILLSEDVLDRFSLGSRNNWNGNGGNNNGNNGNLSPYPHNGESDIGPLSPGGTARAAGPKANSHLSLLAMVDCWAALGINPFLHLDLAATPLFRMWIGVAEYLFRSEERLGAAIDAAINDVSFRSDDLEFVVAARGWSQCVSFGNFELYKQRFASTASFFRPRFDEAVKVGSSMIKAILDNPPVMGTPPPSSPNIISVATPTPPRKV